MFWFDQMEKYSGQWENDMPNGYGISIWYEVNKSLRSLKNRYIGQWKDGKRNGYGIFFYSNGSIYEGYWKNDSKDGFGVFTFQNGDCYEGLFRNNKMIEISSTGLIEIDKNKEGSSIYKKRENNSELSKLAQKSQNNKIEEDNTKKDLILPKIDENKSINQKIKPENAKVQSKKESKKDKEVEKSNIASVIVKDAGIEALKIMSNAENIRNLKNLRKSKIEEKKEANNKSSKSGKTNKKDGKTSFLKGKMFIASDLIIHEHTNIQFKNLLDFSDLVEIEDDIKNFYNEIEGALQRNSSEIKKIFYRLLKGGNPTTETLENDVENYFNMKMGMNENSLEEQFKNYGAENKEGEIECNDLESKQNEINDPSIYFNDNSIGSCVELKDVWKFFKENGIISFDFSVAQFNRLFYRNKKNSIQMFIIPEDIPKRNQFEYIYTMIDQAMINFKKKYEVESEMASEIEEKNKSISKSIKAEEIDHSDKKAINTEYLEFNPHYHKNILLLRNFYDVFIRLAHLKFYQYDLPLFKKVEMIFQNINIQKTKNKERTYLSKGTTNLMNSAIMTDSFCQIDTNEKTSKTNEKILFDNFIQKFGTTINSMFLRLYYMYTEQNSIKQNYHDVTISNRFIFENIIKKSEILSPMYGTKELFYLYISHFHKDKKNNFKNKKEQFEFYEQILDLEVIMYEFNEFIFIATSNYTNLNGLLCEDGSISDKYFELIIGDIQNIIENNINLNQKYIHVCAKYNYEFPINECHIKKKQLKEMKIRELHEEYLKRIEKTRVYRERKNMALESSNVFIKNKFADNEEEEEDSLELSDL